MKMVRADLAASGVIFTLDTESGVLRRRVRHRVVGSWRKYRAGQGRPGRVYVDKADFSAGLPRCSSRCSAPSSRRLVYARGHGHASTRNLPTHRAERERFRLADPEGAGTRGLRDPHRGSLLSSSPANRRRTTSNGPRTGGYAVYIVQARPETVALRRPLPALSQTRHAEVSGPVLATGHVVGEKSRPAWASANGRFTRPRCPSAGSAGCRSNQPTWEPVMKTAAAIVTSHGGRTCHAAIVARERRAGSGRGRGAVERLKNGQAVTSAALTARSAGL